MNPTTDLLDAYRAATASPSDYAAAARLNVTRATVSRWRNALGHPEADAIERMCKATRRDPAKWLPLIEAERARSPAARAAWLRIAAAACLCIALLTPTQSRASDGMRPFTITSQAMHMRKSSVGEAIACFPKSNLGAFEP